MDFLKQNKILIGGVAAAVLVAGIYFMYFSGGSSPVFSSTDTQSPISQELLVTLQNLHTIKLDASVFEDPAFQSLSDFGVIIPPQNVGRRNPFAPLQGSGSGAAGITLPGAR